MCISSDVNGEKIVRTFYEKELQKTSQKKRQSNEDVKVIKAKGMKIHSITGLI